MSVRGWTHRLYTSTPFLPPMQVHPSYCHFLFCGPVPFMTDVRGACFFMLFFWGSFWCVLFHAILCVAAFFFFKMYFCLSVCPAPRIPYHRPFTLTHTIQQTNKQLTKPHLTTIRAARLAQCPAGADLVRVLRPPGRRGGRRGDAAVLLDWGRDWG